MWRPPRAHHCRVCKRCVRKMDHHCPWVNTCVGEWNQKFFILFLFYTLFCSLLACAVIAIYWKTVWESGSTLKFCLDILDLRQLYRKLIIPLLKDCRQYWPHAPCCYTFDRSLTLRSLHCHDTLRSDLCYYRRRGRTQFSASFFQLFFQTAVEARKRESGKSKRPIRKRQVTNLTKMREVFGPGSYWSWLLPRANRKSQNSPMLTPLLSYSV